MTVFRNDQEEAAVFTLRYMRNKLLKLMKMDVGSEIPTYFIQGTKYHDGRGAAQLESIAARLNAVQFHCIHGTGKWSKEVCGISFDSVNENLAHHVGSAGGFIKSGGIDRELLWSVIAGSEDNALQADLLVRPQKTGAEVCMNECKRMRIRWSSELCAFPILNPPLRKPPASQLP